VTALSLYGLLFIVAEITATYKRPSFISDDVLFIRLGIRWQAAIPLSDINNISRISKKPLKSELTLNGGLIAVPNTLITFKQPIWINGSYSIKKRIDQLSIFVDNQPELVRDWAQITISES